MEQLTTTSGARPGRVRSWTSLGPAGRGTARTRVKEGASSSWGGDVMSTTRSAAGLSTAR